jgi:CarboxypepD_reg-like domain
MLRAGFFFFVLLLPEIVFCQLFEGKVIVHENNSGVAFVNVGIIGKNVGTVTDQSGNFSLQLDKIYDKDSIRFSMIGYESRSFLVRAFKDNAIKTIYLGPKSYSLTEVKIVYHKAREVRLGIPVTSDALKSGFAENNLGSELGVKLKSKGQVKLEDINLNVATCTYDSVTYRLNIYQTIDEIEYKNILTQPIYISFSKDKIDKPITLGLGKYSIVVEGDILVTLELYKDLGEGKLLFYTQYFTSFTYHKKTSEGKWTKAPGAIGMYLHVLRIKDEL